MLLANLFNLVLQGLLILIIVSLIFLVYKFIFNRENIFNLVFCIGVLVIVRFLLIQFIEPLTTTNFF